MGEVSEDMEICSYQILHFTSLPMGVYANQYHLCHMCSMICLAPGIIEVSMDMFLQKL